MPKTFSKTSPSTAMASSSFSSQTFAILSIIITLLPLFNCDEVHELLHRNGLPQGLLPKQVKSYNLDQLGRLEVFLYGPCLTKYENRVYFESVIRGNLSYGELRGLEGLSQEELFLWLPVRDIIVDDPSSGLILFDVGVVHKQFALSLFEDPPDCKPQESKPVLSFRSGISRKEKGFGFATQKWQRRNTTPH